MPQQYYAPVQLGSQLYNGRAQPATLHGDLIPQSPNPADVQLLLVRVQLLLVRALLSPDGVLLFLAGVLLSVPSPTTVRALAENQKLQVAHQQAAGKESARSMLSRTFATLPR
jgi:hypothetical protein